jgi:hypothetical protein
MITSSRNTRRLLALCALAWINLLIQPCLAQSPAMPASMENCGHPGDASLASCPEMTTTGCATSNDSFVGTAPGIDVRRYDFVIATLTPDIAGVRPLPRSATAGDSAGPPLTIRYCNLRN